MILARANTFTRALNMKDTAEAETDVNTIVTKNIKKLDA